MKTKQEYQEALKLLVLCAFNTETYEEYMLQQETIEINEKILQELIDNLKENDEK